MKEFSTCPHFSLCSGCTLDKDIFNPPIWQEALHFFPKSLQPRLITDGFSGTRFKAKLAVRSGPEIGLFKKNSHDVLSIPHCQVHHPSINQAVAILKQEILAHNLPPYRENPHSGLLRYVQLFACRETGKIQLVLILNSSHAPEAFCRSLQKHDLWHSIWLNFHPNPSNRIFGDSWLRIQGEPFLYQNKVAFHPGAFFQTHLPLFEKMLSTIDSWIEPQQKILELYAGVGAISLALAHKASRIDLVENNPYAHLSFLASSPPPHLTYHCLDAKDAPLEDNQLIIVDPPRKGLEAALLDKLCSLNRSHLIYVSCGFDSFKRDSEKLLAAGWKFKRAEGYLLFPGTNHVEILAELTLNR